MSSRDKILAAVKKNQPGFAATPDLHSFLSPVEQNEKRFKDILVSIGGAVIEVEGSAQIKDFISRNFPEGNIVSTIPDLQLTPLQLNESLHQLENVNLAVLPGKFAVAENGAVWITDAEMGDRALPFITEHLALVVRSADIVPTLHHAYEIIETASYNLGTFIAGPSKTADIEQSLVLGAHGAKSLIVFLVKSA